MSRLKSNNRYNTILTQRFDPSTEDIAYVRNVPENFPTFITFNYGQIDESTFLCGGQLSETTLVDLTLIKGVYNVYEPDMTTVDCLNWAEFFNQYADVQTSFVATDVSVESSNDYALEVSFGNDELTAGTMLQWSPLHANTGAVTVKINDLDPIAVVKDGDQPLIAGDLIASRWVIMLFDGTSFQLYAIGAEGPQGLKGDKGDPGGVSVDALEDITWILDSTNTNSYVGTFSTPLTSYAAGYQFNLMVANANTGAATLNIDSLGAVAIKKNVNEALTGGEIKAGQVTPLVYDGTNFQIVGGGSGGGGDVDEGQVALISQVFGN